MTRQSTPWLIALIAAGVATAFALTRRLPLPFDGFAVMTAAGLAFLLALSAVLFLPKTFIWTDAERLHHAFSVRHGLTDARAQNALSAITTAHDRAATLRTAATTFREDLKRETESAADLLDRVARDIFYEPGALSAHRANIIRSELVEDAVKSHAKLRDRSQSGAIDDQITRSRKHVSEALMSMQQAFDLAENRLANQLLTEVDVASATAETLLRPRGSRQKERHERGN